MKFSNLSECTRCLKALGVGDVRGWCSDGFIYCPPCMQLTDEDMRKARDPEEERKNRKATERLKVISEKK